MAKAANQKIIDGLKDAVRFARCPHEWLVDDIVEDRGKRVFTMTCRVCEQSQRAIEPTEK